MLIDGSVNATWGKIGQNRPNLTAEPPELPDFGPESAPDNWAYSQAVLSF